MNDKLKNELASFQELWNNGFFDGDPLNPLARSSYQEMGFVSVLYATYLRCIKPYINKNTVSLEIGPGRGAWTKGLLPSKEVYVLDALPEAHNKFFEYLGNPNNVKYFQVNDFECKELPDNYFNYVFSFGCLCHVSFEGITAYARNMYPKLRPGSNCFWMVADYDKYNNAISNIDKLSIWNVLAPALRASTGHRHKLIKWLFTRMFGYVSYINDPPMQFVEPDKDDNPSPGRWYHAGIERTCAMLKNVGYQVVDPDVGTCLRDPVIHFLKP